MINKFKNRNFCISIFISNLANIIPDKKFSIKFIKKNKTNSIYKI